VINKAQDANCVLRKIKQLRKKGGDIKLNNEELHNLHPPPNIASVNKPRGMILVGNLTHEREK
jgi:hypothetical protein